MFGHTKKKNPPIIRYPSPGPLTLFPPPPQKKNHGKSFHRTLFYKKNLKKTPKK